MDSCAATTPDTKHWEFEMNIARRRRPGKGRAQQGCGDHGTRNRVPRGQRTPIEPFFLFLHFYDVHTDFTPDEKWEKEFVTPYDGIDHRQDGKDLVTVRHSSDAS